MFLAIQRLLITPMASFSKTHIGSFIFLSERCSIIQFEIHPKKIPNAINKRSHTKLLQVVVQVLVSPQAPLLGSKFSKERMCGAGCHSPFVGETFDPVNKFCLFGYQLAFIANYNLL